MVTELPTAPSARLTVVDGEVAAASVLELACRTRVGGGRTERRFSGFIVDGDSLYDRLAGRVYDLVSLFGWPHGHLAAPEGPGIDTGSWPST